MSSIKYPLGSRLSDAFTMFNVLLVSLLLLVYVAFGEAKHTYERYLGDKMSGQVGIVQNAMQTPLQSGLSLHQFVGFKTLTDPIFNSDATIGSLIVYDLDGSPVFTAGDPEIVAKFTAVNRDSKFAPARRALPHEPGSRAAANDGETQGESPELEREFGQYRIVVPLKNKFEFVGSLAISMSEAAVTSKVKKSFEPLFYASFVFSFVFAMFIAIFGARMARGRVPWAQISFAVVFLVASLFVIATLISLYSEGAQAKSRALSAALGQRLNDVVAFNININEIDGLDQMFAQYAKLNPDISEATLTVDGRIVIHSDPSRVGQIWSKSDGHYEYVVDLTPRDSGRFVQVAVGLPGDIVLERIARSVKNFAALFIASAFLASLFFHLGGAVRRPLSRREGKSGSKLDAIEDREWILTKLKPVFFLGVLLEHLTYAFLPQFVQGAVIEAGVSSSLASAPFVGFYLLFALTLIPAGNLAEKIGPKPLMTCGLLLAGSGLAMLAFYPEFWMIMLARCLSGIGQGMLFIGVQSYLLAVASPEKKTQAAGIIVYGFQGGMISGMAVGSMLVGYMGTTGVFLLAAAIATVAALYASIAVPKISIQNFTKNPSVKPSSLTQSLGKAVRNYNFINTMMTIGVPAKAVLTGVITFALPLLLTKSGYQQEDIGQIIMIYAICVVASSGFISSHVDNFGNTRGILFQGALISGAGLALIAASGSIAFTDATTMAQTAMLVIGVMLIGIAHGFVNAPVITHIADSQLATQIGANAATSTYRFAERLGHVAGPVLVGQLLIWTNFDWSSMGFVGLVVALFGLIFFLSTDRDQPTEPRVEGPTGTGSQNHLKTNPLGTGALHAPSVEAAPLQALGTERN